MSTTVRTPAFQGNQTPQQDGPSAKTRRLNVMVTLSALALLLVAVEVTQYVRRAPVSTRALSGPPHSENPVVALGAIVPGNAVLHLNAPASSGEAQIQRLFVREDDIVAPGQILGTLDSIDRLKAAVGVARAQVASKQAALNKVLAGNSRFEIAAQRSAVERLRAEADRQDSDFRRYQALHQDGLISEAEWETHAQSFHSASASLAEAQASLGRSAEIRPVDIDIASADLHAEQASLASAEANVQQAYIRAPVSGRILHIYTWPGERVSETGVLDLAANDRTFVEAEVYETDLNRIRPGEAATVTSAALSQPLHGSVSLIERSITRQQVVNIDPAANTDARVAIVRVLLDPASNEVASRRINLQVRVEFEP